MMDWKRWRRIRKLDVRLEARGLCPYAGKKELPDVDSSRKILEGFLRSGYPSLEEVSVAIEPSVRKLMLEKKKCWKDFDLRCLRFVHGTGTGTEKKGSHHDYRSEAEYIRRSIKKEQKERVSRLREELVRRNLPGNVESFRERFDRIGQQLAGALETLLDLDPFGEVGNR